MYIPANATEGDLTIHSSGMDLAYHAHQQPTSRAGQRVFVWDGRTSDGNAANTGIYVFVFGLGNRTVTGKIALVRK
ncbi:MAG TPA: FlgD immunoglobulin-like domain containing protein [Bacteroidota bacterium]|nr:FlgD immunoglobulin-like domain containing protein [Bacteroidota bacterium]